MEKYAIQIGKLGSALGVLAGLTELSIGTDILPWIGNKENPVVLGLTTLLLSTIAFVSVSSANKHIHLTNDRKLALFFGIFIPAAVCFTTVGRLWYVPGTLLLATSLLLGHGFWFGHAKISSTKIISRKFGADQIIGVIGSLFILVSVVLAFSNSIFSLFKSQILANTTHVRFEVFPMDIVRFTKISGSIITVDDTEVRLMMVVYILLILGASIALISSLVKSRIFSGIGGIIIFTGLILFLFWLPEILALAKLPSVRLQDIIRSLGIGWYISIVGMSLIMITSLFKIQTGNTQK